MRTAIIQRRIESLPALSRAGKRINGLHRLMRSPYLFERAYSRVARNKGALTPGIDGKTFDGTTLEKLAGLARRVAEGTYHPRPVRRVTPWKQAARRRKTIVLCRPCHLTVHGRRSSGMESRVH